MSSGSNRSTLAGQSFRTAVRGDLANRLGCHVRDLQVSTTLKYDLLTTCRRDGRAPSLLSGAPSEVLFVSRCFAYIGFPFVSIQISASFGW
jgi:hypothetical protein